jgi:hypothetical protein
VAYEKVKSTYKYKKQRVWQNVKFLNVKPIGASNNITSRLEKVK